MSKVTLQKTIQKGQGYVLSSGTLNLEHLLSVAHDIIIKYRLDDKVGGTSLRKLIRGCFIQVREAEDLDVYLKEGGLWELQYFGVVRLNTGRYEVGQWTPQDIWEACISLFESVTPEGYYFGTLEGDGSCIGWFLLGGE